VVPVELEYQISDALLLAVNVAVCPQLMVVFETIGVDAALTVATTGTIEDAQAPVPDCT
jgi:hypothetical protein